MGAGNTGGTSLFGATNANANANNGRQNQMMGGGTQQMGNNPFQQGGGMQIGSNMRSNALNSGGMFGGNNQAQNQMNKGGLFGGKQPGGRPDSNTKTSPKIHHKCDSCYRLQVSKFVNSKLKKRELKSDFLILYFVFCLKMLYF